MVPELEAPGGSPSSTVATTTTSTSQRRSSSTAVTPALPPAPPSPMSVSGARNSFMRRHFKSAASMPLPSLHASARRPHDQFNSHASSRTPEGAELVLCSDDDLQELEDWEEELPKIATPSPRRITQGQAPVFVNRQYTNPVFQAAYKHSCSETLPQLQQQEQQQELLLSRLRTSEAGNMPVRARAMRSLTTLHREIEPWCGSPTAAPSLTAATAAPSPSTPSITAPLSTGAEPAQTSEHAAGGSWPSEGPNPFARKAHIEDGGLVDRADSTASLSKLLHDGRSPMPADDGDASDETPGPLQCAEHAGLYDDDDSGFDLGRLSELLNDGRGHSKLASAPSVVSRPGIASMRTLRASQSILSRAPTSDDGPCASPRRGLRTMQSFGATLPWSPRTDAGSRSSDDGWRSTSSNASASIKNLLNMLTPSRSKVLPATPEGTVHGGKAASSIFSKASNSVTSPAPRRSITSPGYSLSAGGAGSPGLKPAATHQSLTSPQMPRQSVPCGIPSAASSDRQFTRVESVRRHCWVDGVSEPNDP